MASLTATRRALFSLAFACLFAAPPGARAQDTNSDPARAEFDREADPVKRAKMFTKVGDSLYRNLRNEVDRSNYEEAEKLLISYRDTARALHTSLKAAVPDPEKKPGGFKHLQIHVRKTIRNLGQTILSIPIPLRVPFLAVRSDLETLDKHLLDDLFPRQPGRRPGTEKPKG